MGAEEGKKRRSSLRRSWGRLKLGAHNAAEIVRLGRLTAPHRAPFDVAHQDRCYSLRHYRGAEAEPKAPALLLVPPLMVTSEIYDMSPDVSAVSYLVGQGVDVWMVDFGAPERVEGGLTRTLDDHVLAVSSALDHIGASRGAPVHLAGYSQGGMFCYQVAAYRGGRGIASLITFGSPVDIHRNLPLPLAEGIAENVISGLRAIIERPLERMDALPGLFTSIGFKLVSPKKELEQLFDFVAKLHDRKALEKREDRRRFLGGEGFVAWPGPALKTFIDEFIVKNRLASGGFVIDGRSVSLSDIDCPILFFVGLKDDIARPASVRAIRDAATRADAYEVGVRAGHLGLVVGGRASATSWPTVLAWLRWIEGEGPKPAILEDARAARIEDIDDSAFDDLDLDVEDFYDFAADALEDAWRRLGRVGLRVSDAVDTIRWQLPRLRRLERIGADTRVSAGLVLAEQAEKIPDQTFFLWRGRAFTYADADRRVDAVVRGLLAFGLRPGQRVGVLMDARPSHLTLLTALSRLGAVGVLLDPSEGRVALPAALEVGQPDILVTDLAHAERARAVFEGEVWALGGPFGERRRLPAGVKDLEEVEPSEVDVPSDFEPNAGRGGDLSLILFTGGSDETLRAARITNRRWAMSALGTAAGCSLDPNDTVYCALPLHHAAGILVSVGGALVGGSRLALATSFEPPRFWDDVRRYGVSVVFYAGEMCRALVDEPPAPDDANNPVRLFAGSGMRRDVWQRLATRFQVSVLEFYASTEGNAILANASGQKVGALGRPLPGAAEMTLVAWDFEREDFSRDASIFASPEGDGLGQIRRAGVDEPGVMIARVDAGHPMAGFDGYADGETTGLLTDVFEAGDRWFSTGDLLRQDADGDHWFVDRLADVIRTDAGPVFTRKVEDLLYRRPDVRMVVVHAAVHEGETVVVATIVARGETLDLSALAALVDEKLPPHARPRFVRRVARVEKTAGYRPLKRPLAARALEAAEGVTLYARRGSTYEPR